MSDNQKYSPGVRKYIEQAKKILDQKKNKLIG